MDYDVIYVGGYGRSGSTILGLLLGQLEGLFLAGEVGVIDIAINESRLCTCGVKISECDFWSDYINYIVDKSDTHKSFLVEDYALKMSGASCIIDTTKTSWFNSKRPLKLSKQGKKIYFIHLYRPLKQVLISAKKGINTDLEFNITRKEKFVKLRTIIGWLLANFIASFYRYYFGNNSIFINFNDLLNNTSTVLDNINCLDAGEIEILKKIVKNKNHLETNHEINGNRLLRQKSPIIFGYKNDVPFKDYSDNKSFTSIN